MTDSEQACIAIYNDYDSEEIESFCPAIITAWGVGKELTQKQERA